MTIDSLCDWIGVPAEKGNMLTTGESTFKQNSAFVKTDTGRKNYLIKDNYDRQQHLSIYEKEVIQKMNCPNLLSAMDYERQDVVFDFKNIPSDLNTLKYERALRLMIRSYLSPLPPKKAIIISSKIIVESFKLFFSVNIFSIKKLFNKYKKKILLGL
jgi:hypothetical protein